MKKIDCDIIQDLIPLYVEHACSEASKQCVEAHLKECQECQKNMKLCEEHAFAATSIELKEIDGLKKIKQKIRRQNVLSGALMLLLVILGIYAFETSFTGIGISGYYVLFPICLVGTYFLTKDEKSWKRIGRIEYVLGGISILASLYATIIIHYSMRSLMNGNLPFSTLGVEVVELGPFIHNQWEVLFVMQLVICACLGMRVLKQHIDCCWMLSMNLMGIFILISFGFMLRDLLSPEEGLRLFNQVTIIMWIMGIMGAIIIRFVNKKNKLANCEIKSN